MPTLIADGEGEDKVLARYLAAHPDEDRELIVFVIVDAEPPEIRPGSEESRRSGKPRWDYRRRREERTV
ncbi:hypothetical protein W911_14595 [Hyphomicrobium nitrativorans NL23]|uniref:Uncharacterized protein n=1 Tax=Hyphomicrobium nitrativorans NL23 TaxID=1029756 RepID=V5SHL1_9HYPH|nr:hypothetical protein W911_14595 [Hyphomicrobium nitrativorans NL23]